MLKQLTVIPAEPGWSLLVPIWDESGEKCKTVGHDRIIAWRIETEETTHKDGDPILYEFVAAITADNTNQEGMVLSDPAGQLFTSMDQTFSSIEDVIAYYQSQKEMP